MTPASDAHLTQDFYIRSVFRGLPSSLLAYPPPLIRVCLCRRGESTTCLFLLSHILSLFCPGSCVSHRAWFPSLFFIEMCCSSSKLSQRRPSHCLLTLASFAASFQQHRVWTHPRAPKSSINKASVCLRLKEEFS